MGLCFIRFCHIYDVHFCNHTNNSINAYIFISTFLWLMTKERLEFMAFPTCWVNLHSVILMAALILNVISGLSGGVQCNNNEENELNFLHGLHRACCSTCSHFEGRIRQRPAGRKWWNRKTES